jgi:integrase
MSSATTSKRKRPQRGLGYSIESRSQGGVTVFRVRVWNPRTKRREPVPNPDTGDFTFPWRPAAVKAAETYKAELDEGLTAGGKEVKRQRARNDFDALVKEYLPYVEREGQQKTNNERRRRLLQIGRELKHPDAAGLSRDDIVKYDTALKTRGLKDSTRQGYLSTLNQFFKWIVKEKPEVRTDNPCEIVSFKRLSRMDGDVRYLTQEEFLYLGYFVPYFFWAAMVLAYESGLRAAEVAGLRWQRVHMDSPVPFVHIKDVMQPDGTRRGSTKGGGERYVYLSPFAVKVLKELLAWRGPSETDSNYVIRSSKNQPIPANAPHRYLREAYRKSGLEGAIRPKFHHLRHSFGAEIVESTGDVRAAQMMLGHANLETTMIYMKKVELAHQQTVLARRTASRQQSAEDGLSIAV